MCISYVQCLLIQLTSAHTVVLVGVFLHKSPFPPYRRGFFCNDNSIGLTYKSSTVSTTVLTAVSVTVPVASVSPAAVLQDNQREYVRTLGSSNGWLVTRLARQAVTHTQWLYVALH